jgi:hypothetical protein
VESATLRYHVWHAIEEDWDYAYLTVSADNGVTWEALPSERASDEDPNGTAFGPGLTGSSGGWVEDSVDLSRFAGSQVLFRIEYITDDAIHDRGACFDDFSIEEMGWSDDTETDGGWTAAGFVRINGRQPVDYLVQVIRDTPNGPASVQEVPVNAEGEGSATINAPTGSQQLVIAVSVVTTDITGDLDYTLRLDER